MSREHHSRQSPATTGEIRKFKGATVFEWDSEPADERPSEFAETTQIAGPWGPASNNAYVALETRRSRPRTPRRGSSTTLWLALALVAAIGGGGLFALMKLFHA